MRPMMTNLFRSRLLALVLATGLLASPITAHEGHQHGATELTLGSLTLAGFFTKATLPNQPVGAGFLTITNAGTEDDRLIAASSPMAADVQIHEMKMDGDMMKMAELPDGLLIPAGQTVTLAPGGFHLMFMDLTAAFVAGAVVPVSLTFEKAGTIDIELPVLANSAETPEAPMAHDAH